MTGKKPETPVYCGVCGRVMGKKRGVQVTLDLVCDDAICLYQEPVTVNERRDALIVAGFLEKVPVSQIASQTGMSRQRVYQIVDAWKEGA